MKLHHYALFSLVGLAVAPGCSCLDHPEIGHCSGDVCVGPKSEHEVTCDCGIDALIGPDAHFPLRICLPPALNNETGTPEQVAAINAMTDQEYADAVAAYCSDVVAPSLHDVVGFLNHDACGFATVSCSLIVPEGQDHGTVENPVCDVPCAAIDCIAPADGGAGGTGGGAGTGGGGGTGGMAGPPPNCDPAVVAPDDGSGQVHPEFCKCTQADGCSDITGESICIEPTWAPDPPTIGVGMLTRMVSLASDVALDHDLSSAALTVSIDPPFPCGSDTSSVTTAVQGSVGLYGRPCAPGDTCSYLLDFNVYVDDFQISFDTGFPCGGDTEHATRMLVRGGTQGTHVTIGPDGLGTIPAGALRITADGILNGNDRFTFDSTSTEPVLIHVDWAAGTFEMPSATLTFDDGQATVALVGTITGQPPRANAGPDQVVECTSLAGTPVNLDGSASTDPDGDLAFFNWWQGKAFDPSAAVGTGATTQVLAPLGTSTYTLTVSDSRLATHADETKVTVVDTSGPAITVQVTPSELSPPNHKLVDCTATVTVADACDPTASFVLTSITSDEPDDGNGDGNTSDDIQGADFGTPDLHFKLRAERKGNGNGRTYTITYTATDGHGNTSDGVATVKVAH